MSDPKQAKPALFPVIDAPTATTKPVSWLDTPPANQSPIRNLFETDADAPLPKSMPSAASYPPPPNPDGPGEPMPIPESRAPAAQARPAPAPQPRAAASRPPPPPPPPAQPDPEPQLDERAFSQLPPPPRLGSLIPGARSAPPPAPSNDYSQAQSEHAEAFASAAVELAVARTAALSELEGQLLDLAVEIASALIERELEREPELHSTLARAALASLGDAERVTLRTSPHAYETICHSLGGHEANVRGVHVQVAADATIPGLGCVVDGDNMRVDATVSERLRAVRRAFEDERRKLGENLE